MDVPQLPLRDAAIGRLALLLDGGVRPQRSLPSDHLHIICLGLGSLELPLVAQGGKPLVENGRAVHHSVCLVLVAFRQTQDRVAKLKMFRVNLNRKLTTWCELFTEASMFLNGLEL